MDGKSEMPFPPSHARERERESPGSCSFGRAAGGKMERTKRNARGKQEKEERRKRRKVGKGGKKRKRAARDSAPALPGRNKTKEEKKRK